MFGVIESAAEIFVHLLRELATKSFAVELTSVWVCRCLLLVNGPTSLLYYKLHTQMTNIRSHFVCVVQLARCMCDDLFNINENAMSAIVTKRQIKMFCKNTGIS